MKTNFRSIQAWRYLDNVEYQKLCYQWSTLGNFRENRLIPTHSSLILGSLEVSLMVGVTLDVSAIVDVTP